MDDKEVLVKVEGLGKKFCKDLKKSLKYGATDVMRSLVGKSSKESLRKGEFWALKDINFELRRGECLGLLGHNGAGKSTLLKVLNGLIKPDEGTVTIRGKVGALIELGAGFNPILTGRENIYNNASVLGFTKAEIDAKLENIIEFSEIREFIDAPVQTYSSGMKVRLGFSVAAQMEPDVLFIDEVLAVGDVGFRIKCLNRIFELLETSCVIFVSHAMPQVGRICTSGLLMERGKVEALSKNVPEMIKLYELKFKNSDLKVVGSGVELANFNFKGKKEISINDDLNIEFQLNFSSDLENVFYYFTIIDNTQRTIAICESPLSEKVTQGTVKKVALSINALNMTDGIYAVGLNVYTKVNDKNKTIARFINIDSFVVSETNFFVDAPFVLNSKWSVNDGNLN